MATRRIVLSLRSLAIGFEARSFRPSEFSKTSRPLLALNLNLTAEGPFTSLRQGGEPSTRLFKPSTLKTIKLIYDAADKEGRLTDCLETPNVTDAHRDLVAFLETHGLSIQLNQDKRTKNLAADLEMALVLNTGWKVVDYPAK